MQDTGKETELEENHIEVDQIKITVTEAVVEI